MIEIPYEKLTGARYLIVSFRLLVKKTLRHLQHPERIEKTVHVTYHQAKEGLLPSST